LTFALKYEGLDLAVLSRLFASVAAVGVEEIVRSTPTGSYARRLWLPEWTTGERLDLPDAGRNVPYADVVDPAQQFAVSGENVARQRVRNNLPGTRAFCPLVFRTQPLAELTHLDLAARAQAVVGSSRRPGENASAPEGTFRAVPVSMRVGVLCYPHPFGTLARGARGRERPMVRNQMRPARRADPVFCDAVGNNIGVAS
jgi:hypothetical protein